MQFPYIKRISAAETLAGVSAVSVMVSAEQNSSIINNVMFCYPHQEEVMRRPKTTCFGAVKMLSKECKIVLNQPNISCFGASKSSVTSEQRYTRIKPVSIK